METPIHIDVANLPSAVRHQTICQAFEQLSSGQGLVLTVDHDPKPLFYELRYKYPQGFSWEYAKEGPDIWEVLITRKQHLENRTVGDLVMEDLALGKVFESYGIDFCCQGNITLEEACRKQKLDINEILVAMTTKTSDNKLWQPHFEDWSVVLLITYILENHHGWERRTMADIEELVERVAEHHGEAFPALWNLKDIVGHLKYAIESHFAEEEQMLFPLILEGSKSAALLKELERMKIEHTEVGTMLADITLLTNNFQAPPGACGSFLLLYQKLNDLKQDLLQHIHLENTLLVAKAVA